MTTYLAPTKDMNFVLNELAGMKMLARIPGFEDATEDMVEAILVEASKLSSEVLSPLNKIGDEQGSHLVDGKVRVAEGFTDAYQQYIDNGWLGLGQEVELGGQGLPYLLHTAVSEMWNSANLSFALCPLLTVGAIEAIKEHDSDDIKSTFLPPMVSGHWTGTMNLTEAQAGSDLAAVRTRAEPNGDHYLISGQKIFITWSDHEMSENVIHLVLARLPDAPSGIKGISLFVVPKFLINKDGTIGERNDVHAVSLEHKLGVHASPTCVMSFGDKGGAIGYLVGEPHHGMAYMFTMMNHARLGCGLQGVAIAERAYQQAADYARDRIQGNATGHPERVAIIQHADVRRMLMLMRSLTEAMRSLTYVTAAELDKSLHDDDAEQRASSQNRLELLTPVTKAWCTEVAQEVTTLGVQIHGGMGFIEETGAAQHFRDARIITIYEGTTGIQALDLVGRKILRDGGEAMHSLLAELEIIESKLDKSNRHLNQIAGSMSEGRQMLKQATEWMLEHAVTDPNLSGSVSVNFLMLTGTVLGGWQMARAALVAQQKLDVGDTDTDFYHAKMVFTRFYFEQVMPRAKAYFDAVTAGVETVMELPAEQL